MLCKLILSAMGWEKLDYDGELNKHEQIVCVFSHSSYYDFFIMVLYKYAYPDKLCNLKTLIKPDYFDSIGGYFLKKVGGIPATNISYKNGGATDRIVDMLKDGPCKFLISPKGTILRGEWRTGYYHIAQGLRAPIIPVGLDYERKGIYVGNVIDSTQEEPHIKKLLYEELGNIVPLYEEQENMPIRPHNKQDVSVISSKRLFGIFMITVSSIGSIYYICTK
jgi:hypothetical protein